MAEFKPKTFSPGLPVTAQDLNDLQSNIRAVQDKADLTNTTITTIDGTIKQVKSSMASGVVEITAMSKGRVSSPDFRFNTNFAKAPAAVVSIAEPLKSEEDIDISVEVINRSAFKINAKSNTDRKSLKVSYVAILVEEV